MKILKLLSFIVTFIFFGVVSPFFIWAQQAPPARAQGPAPVKKNVNPGPGGPASIELNERGLSLEVLEDFEEAEDWYAKPTCPLGDTRLMKFVQRGEIRTVGEDGEAPPQDENYSLAQSPDNPNHILGIKSYFDNMGFDRVEVKAAQDYKITGKARQFSIWVLGRNYKHFLWIRLKDYRGKIHKLRIGRLDFYGWKKMTVLVPGWLPQSTRYSLLGKNLLFQSVFVVSDYKEPVGEFYFYVDALKVIVDRDDMNYPGSEIKDVW